MEDLFPDIPEDFAALSDEDLASFISQTEAGVAEVTADPSAFVSEEIDSDAVFAATTEAVDALEAARAEAASRLEAASADEAEEEVADAADRFAELATRAQASSSEDEGDEGDDGDADGDGDGDGEATTEAAADAVVAAAALEAAKPAVRHRLPRPTARRQALAVQEKPKVALTASSPNLGYDIGEELPNGIELALMMEKKRATFGNNIAVKGEKVPVGKFDWRDRYPAERTLGMSEGANMELVAAAYDDGYMRAQVKARLSLGLQASGGLCAPVTPYYDLQYISVSDRPVRAALAAFNADRGGMRYARPASLGDITTAVGVRTSTEDAAGGTEAEKSCQVVDCPPFIETDVQIIYHCLQFGNLGARTFPERVAQWNNLVLAAHARLAESELLTSIDAFSTKVSASDLGLGASATYPNHLLTAAAGIRSVNRMANDAVLRALIPIWVLDLLVSDVYRTQFQRFEMTKDGFVALLRANNIEPSFYMDSANGRGQVFDPQGDGFPLEAFPAIIWTYLFPEGSFIYLDGGTLELGLVRDSVLNRTNDFQIFGETFENVAFVGIESYAIGSAVCDSGTVSAPAAVTCPIVY